MVSMTGDRCAPPYALDWDGHVIEFPEIN
ncbi:hypothetical protein BWQ96_02462 [Gracilariopsis chorda]|uniref:Uncharacterized protein n=1 Tax=Gracilariopsis chorda TaxID=448386 RepID=A0A2V3J312_9FLOR|nr:hypothetical protein BWQ96_02462 [Gracilariopsis chorda]|eukprot:PXF47780.1 hypothetical protein BWQ96_02462 [Gracilariopsis chorda]